MNNNFLTLLVNEIVGTSFKNAPEIDDLGDIFIGGNGNDNLQGGDKDDIFLPGGGDDMLTGGEGADLLTGGGGNDTLIGGDGVDIFRIGFGAGITAIEDFNLGEDRLQFQQDSLPQARFGSVDAMRDSLTYNSQNGAIALDGVQIATLKNPVEGFDVSTHADSYRVSNTL